MSNVYTLLPTLTLNALFVHDLLAAKPPCFALGYAEERGAISSFLALRPEQAIPSALTQKGFRFGHSVLGLNGAPVLHFVFEFYGHATYHGLVSPGHSIVRRVLATLIETGDYFCFAINPDQTVTAFRARLAQADLAELKTNHERFKQASCAPTQYDAACRAFSKRPDPPGQLMDWVCRDNPDYLDLTAHRLALDPTPS